MLQTKYDAVIVSHYHADHAGLIEYKTDCPIYIGSGAYRVVKAMSEYHGKALASNIATYRNGKTFTVDDIKITPYLCDHSAFDSYMLFEAGGKIPRLDIFNDVVAFTPSPVRGRRKDMFFEFENKRGLTRMANGTKRFTMTIRPSMLGYLKKLADKMGLFGTVLTYSIWNG